MSKKNKSDQKSESQVEPLNSTLEPEGIAPPEESQLQKSQAKDGESLSPSSEENENKKPNDVDKPSHPPSSAPPADLESEPKQNNTSAPELTSKKSGALVPVLILFLLVTIAGAGGLGYFAWQEIQKEQQKIVELDERLNKHSQQLMNASQALSSVEKKVQDQTLSFTTYNQQSGQLEAKLTTQLQAYREQLLTLSTTSNDDWKLAEAYYLTRLAVQRLQMEKSTLGALALLQSADDIVKAQKDPELYRVREALADDITTLQLAGGVDREGIYLQLSSIIKQVENIPSLIPENFQNIKDETSVSADAEIEAPASVIENSFNKFVKHLQGYFRVQHAEENVDLSLSLQDHNLTKTRLILLLESAQLALLREQSKIYQNSLAAAQDILAAYFPDNGPDRASLRTKNLAKLIEEMRGEEILQTLPSIQGSQKTLGEYLERLHKVKPIETKAIETNQVESDLPPKEEVNIANAEAPPVTQQQETAGQQ